jgi:hypothetical protein
VYWEADNEASVMLPPPELPRSRQPGDSRAGAIEIALPNGSRVSVDAFVNGRHDMAAVGQPFRLKV